jgi:prepilin-type N-terminal cleavage/methylation domain-containing protein
MGPTDKKAAGTTLITGRSANRGTGRLGTQPRWGRPAKVGRGFTLLELILVLGLVAMAAPSLSNFMKARKTADAAGQMLALTRVAASRAIAQGAVYRLNVDPQTSAYWLSVQEAGAFVDLECEFGCRFTLPEGTAMSMKSPVDGAPRTYVEFYPSGRTEAATIQLVGSRGEVYQIVCDSPTEEFRVVSPNEVQKT